MSLDTKSLARLVPEAIAADDVSGQESLSLTIERYEFAAKYVRAGRLLDIACGVGCGTRLLVERVQSSNVSALGVDNSEEAISYARKRYGSENVQYIVADAGCFSDPYGFDTIVSLETIKEVSDPEGFTARLIRLLRSGGVLVASATVTPSADANPYHLHDFSEHSFRRMFERHRLREIACLRQVQPFRIIPLLMGKGVRAKDVRRNLCCYYLSHPGSLIRRTSSTLKHGFTNRYLTIAWRADN